MADVPAVHTSRLGRLPSVGSEPVERPLVVVVWVLNQILRRITRHAWQGQEHIPRSGGAVLVVNHISNLDPIVLGQFLVYAGRYPHYLAKAALFRLPVLGPIITACGQIPVERGTAHAAQALSAAVRAVQSGVTVAVYPEGTITLDPQLWPMAGKTGAARIALETSAPVIPVATWGGQHILGAKQMHWPRLFPRRTLKVIAGPPVPLDDLRAQPITPAVLRQATDQIMATITALVAELRGEQPPAKPERSRGVRPERQ